MIESEDRIFLTDKWDYLKQTIVVRRYVQYKNMKPFEKLFLALILVMKKTTLW